MISMTAKMTSIVVASGLMLTLCVACTSSSDSFCSTTVEEACSAVNCPLDWPSDPKAFCGAYGAVNTTQSCGPYLVAEQTATDTSFTYYYDAQTRKLKAVVRNINRKHTCAGGPADFAEPDCSASVWVRVSCSTGSGGSGGSGR